MRTLGVGSRLSMLALSAVAMLGAASLLGAGACSDRAAAESGSPPELLPERSKAEPEQVVQRIVATPGVAAPQAASSPRDDPGAPGAVAGKSRGGDGAPPLRESAREPITSRHLEAELNRLEAELAN